MKRATEGNELDKFLRLAKQNWTTRAAIIDLDTLDGTKIPRLLFGMTLGKT